MGEALARRVRLVVDEFDKAGKSYQEFKPGGRHYHSIPVFSLDISYKRLAAFVALYEKRNVTAAAQTLGISKTAVYNSMRYLEELLELPLFQTEPHGVTPPAWPRFSYDTPNWHFHKSIKPLTISPTWME